jgi:hypothetical protein
MIQFISKILKFGMLGHFIMLKHTNIKEVQNQIIAAMDIFNIQKGLVLGEILFLVATP